MDVRVLDERKVGSGGVEPCTDRHTAKLCDESGLSSQGTNGRE